MKQVTLTEDEIIAILDYGILSSGEELELIEKENQHLGSALRKMYETISPSGR